MSKNKLMSFITTLIFCFRGAFPVNDVDYVLIINIYQSVCFNKKAGLLMMLKIILKIMLFLSEKL